MKIQKLSVSPDILADGHAGNDFLDGISLVPLLRRVQGNLQLKELSWKEKIKDNIGKRGVWTDDNGGRIG